MTAFTNFLNDDPTPSDSDMYDYDLDQLESLRTADVERVHLSGFSIYKGCDDRWCISMAWSDHTQMYAGGTYHSVRDVPLALIQSRFNTDQRILFNFHVTDYHKRVTIEARNMVGNFATFQAVLKGEC